MTTNTINKPSTVDTVNSDGSTTTSTNEGTDSIPTSQNDSAVNLSPITFRLDKISNQVSDIQKTLDDIANFTPTNSAEYTLNLQKFKDAIKDYSFSFDVFRTFIDSVVSDFKTLFSNFNDLKNLFDDKPSVDIPTGTCPFSVS